MTSDYLTTLRREFDGEEGSFILQLRCDFNWDKKTFERLAAAKLRYAEAHASDTNLERWVAEGFWFVPLFTRQWTSHPNFQRPQPDECYEAALQRLDDLASYFFRSFSTYEAGHGFEPLE